MKSCVVLAVIVAGIAFGAAPAAGAVRECEGLQVCVPRVGPWVVVPTGPGAPRPDVAWQLSCPRGYVVGGVSADLSRRAIDVTFLGTLGSPVNPGITTSRSVVFVASYVGEGAPDPSFRPRIGCMPASGGGVRVPTSAAAFPPGHPTTRRVRTVRVRPGVTTVVKGCVAGERLVGASHAFGFFMRKPPDASLAKSVSGTQSAQGDRVAVRVRGDAELDGVRAAVQVHAVCARTR